MKIIKEKIAALLGPVPSPAEGRIYRSQQPFRVIVQKEVMDHVDSWRFVILLGLMALTAVASLYTAMANLQSAIAADPDSSFLFLKLFTATDGALPAFITFVSLLGPIIGIALGFDAVNSERSRGTLSRLMAQPIPRDYIINAKFVAGLLVITFMTFILGFLMIGMGIFITGIPPTPEEFWRLFFFMLVSIVYMGVWLNLAIMFSIRFRQPATSALAGMAAWLFFSLFFFMIINIVIELTAPAQGADPSRILSYQGFLQNLMRLSPSQLFSEATTTLLVPTVRTLGPISMEQAYGAIVGPLPLGQSLLLVWPQLTSLLALAAVLFGLSYVFFMKQEIRSRN